MKETITVFFEQHWPGAEDAPLAVVVIVAATLFFAWLFAKIKDRMTEKIAAFFKRYWPNAANTSLAIGTIVIAVALLSLWVAKKIGVSDEFLALVQLVCGAIAAVLSLLVKHFSDEIGDFIKKLLRKFINAKFHQQSSASESSVTDSPAKVKVDEESTTKNPMSDPVAAGKNEDGTNSETIKPVPADATFTRLLKLAKAGDAESQNFIGVMYSTGSHVEQNSAEAERWYRRAAKQGQPSANANLGHMYANGQGVDQDEAEAAEWYRRAAERGHNGASYSLGMMYADGRGVARDEEEAVKWIRIAAERRNDQAQYNLGMRYSKGQGVDRNEAEAAKWFHLAAEQKHIEAEFNLGMMYADGRGVDQDDAKAVKWLDRAAYNNNTSQEHAQAQNNLGEMYANGRGVKRNGAEAVKLFRRAAELGNADAQGNLGAAYHNGEGVLQNHWEAYIWNSIAATNGIKSSAKYRDEDAKLLPVDDLAKARTEAAHRMEEIRRKQAENKNRE